MAIVTDRLFDGLAFLDGPTLWRAIEVLADRANIGVYVSQLDPPPQRVVYVNAYTARLLDRPAAELVGQVPWSVLHAADVPAVKAAMERPADAPPAVLELTLKRPDGSQVPITLATTRIQTAQGMFNFGYFRDISHEREAVAALRQSEARFRFLVEAAPDGVVIMQRGMIVFSNPKGALLLGADSVDAVLGRPLSDFVPPASAALAGERIAAMLRDGVEFPPAEYGILADPTLVVEIKSIACHWNGAPAVLAYSRDVTERKAIERRLVESDRLAALGTLAAGVAHEINNPLTYATLSTQRIARVIDGLDVPDEVRETLRGHVEDIRHGIRRVASVTHSLHSFVSYGDDEPGPIDLKAVIERALKMVETDLRHAARLVYSAAQAPPALGNASRVEQVLVNVLINAIKALPAGASQRHEIRVELSHHGERITVTISDTGAGIPAALRGRIFDPFFTTRDVGHGMGLGLSVSKAIVEKYGGKIEVDSIENVGTTVRVHLRTYLGSPAVEKEPHAPSRGQRKQVLVVDDEPMICQILERILRDDHDVTVAMTGQEALAALARKQFGLILCDVMMPGMNADELHRRISAEHPDMEQRIVFMSGGILGTEIEKVLESLPNPRLAKPFRIEDVLELVSRMA